MTIGVMRVLCLAATAAAAFHSGVRAQQYGGRAKVPPAVTRTEPAADEHVRTRRLYLDGLHGRLTAALHRFRFTTDGLPSRSDLESGRVRRFAVRDTAGLTVTITVARDPEESNTQLTATRYLLLEGDKGVTRAQPGTPEWRQLERLAQFLAASQPRNP